MPSQTDGESEVPFLLFQDQFYVCCHAEMDLSRLDADLSSFNFLLNAKTIADHQQPYQRFLQPDVWMLIRGNSSLKRASWGEGSITLLKSTSWTLPPNLGYRPLILAFYFNYAFLSLGRYMRLKSKLSSMIWPQRFLLIRTTSSSLRPCQSLFPPPLKISVWLLLYIHSFLSIHQEPLSYSSLSWCADFPDYSSGSNFGTYWLCLYFSLYLREIAGRGCMSVFNFRPFPLRRPGVWRCPLQPICC